MRQPERKEGGRAEVKGAEVPPWVRPSPITRSDDVSRLRPVVVLPKPQTSVYLWLGAGFGLGVGSGTGSSYSTPFQTMEKN